MKTNSSLSNLVKQSLRLSISNIWRNKFLSLATIFVVGTIIFIFNIILAVDFIAKDAVNSLNQKVDIIVYLKESTTPQQSQSLINELQTLPNINKIKHLSKEDALKQMQATHPDLSLAFQKYELGNPLPASINISTNSPEDHKEINSLLKQEKYSTLISNVVSNEESTNNAIMASVFKNLVKVTTFTNQLTFWLIFTFIIGGSLIILNAIHITIFNRKKEIQIMKLVGASHWFIRSPFIIESIIYGTLSIILSIIMLIGITKNITIEENNLFHYYSLGQFSLIIFAEFIATILISILSSSIAVHEYLHDEKRDS
ncbi:hypothetical protein COU74_04260 [Candidatus Peregrinibacteria bacterium CG10_big_fil_rev_8_21_14_0_10_36_19]|nr:MAG: hypothetical protein COU74_04260 [Candidatus Peregrinibacteria bacterium CG10_big_fil_rev_8_21_14_0_10_36_19]